MNGLRRALLLAYSVLLIAAAGGLIALAWNEDRKLDVEIGSLNFQAFVASSDNARLVATAALGAVALLGVVTILIALQRGAAGSRGMLRMRQSDGGSVEVSAGALEALLRDELERLPDVRQATPRVRLAGGAVETDITVNILPSASISHVTNAVTQATSQALREQVGVTNIKRPHIRVTYDEIAARAAALSPRAMPQRAATYPAAAPPSLFEDQPAKPPVEESEKHD